MDFVPFDPPPSEHHPLNTGLSTENGTTAKGLIEGINAYLAHLFSKIEGAGANVIADAKQAGPDIVKLIAHLSDRITVLENDLWYASSKPQAPIEPQPPQPDETPPNPPHVETASEAVQRIHDDLAATIAKAKAGIGTAVTDVEAAIPHSSLADLLAGIGR